MYGSDIKKYHHEDDENITCRDCGKIFEFPATEAAFFESKGYPAPIRCRECRPMARASRRKRQREQQELARQQQRSTFSDVLREHLSS